MTTVELKTIAFEQQFENLKYPAGYLEGIREAYEQHHLALTKLSRVLPSQNVVDPDTLDLLEHRLLKAQEQLLELGASVKLSSQEEILDILKLWHQVAVKEVAPHDVSMTDNLILAVYEYLLAQPTT